MADQQKRSKAKVKTNKVGERRPEQNNARESPKVKCVCGEEAEENAVNCESCRRWIHYRCVGMSAAVIESMEEDCPFFCPQCLFGKIGELQREVRVLKESMTHLREENRELREQLNEVSDLQPECILNETDEVGSSKNIPVTRPTYSATLKRGLANQVVNESIKKIERMQERREKNLMAMYLRITVTKYHIFRI